MCRFRRQRRYLWLVLGHAVLAVPARLSGDLRRDHCHARYGGCRDGHRYEALGRAYRDVQHGGQQ